MSTVIITGGAKGIGSAIVESLSKMGFDVVFTYNTSEAAAKTLESSLQRQGFSVFSYRCNVTNRKEIKDLITYVENKFDNIDVLINNAGISCTKMFQDLTDSDWFNVINTNLTSSFYTIQEVLPNMLNNKRGCIINISSIWGMVGASCEVAYSVSKAGLDGLTKSLAKELGPSNIRVNSIAPGFVLTDMNKNLSDDEVNELKNEIPLTKLGTPMDIAKCVKWLVEDGYTTGQIISPNGGWIIV